MTAGESATDVDGQPRSAGGVSDLGADQFVNQAPTAGLTGGGRAREGRPVSFDASKSADPDASLGGAVVSYRWTFGDGTTATTTTPTTEHAYAQRGDYTATVSVVDNSGASSASGASVPVQVLDGVPPTIKVASPAAKQRIAKLPIAVYGAAADDAGAPSVLLTLRKAAKTKDGRCLWFDGKKTFKARTCAKPTFLTAKLASGQWSYKIPKASRLKRGGYELMALAVDGTGLVSAPAVVPFTLR